MNVEKEGIKIHIAGERRLGYVQEFKVLIHENLGVLKTALKLAQKAEDEYKPANVRVGRGELEWNNKETRFDLIKINGKFTARQPFPQWIWGRGVILVPGETVKDDKTGLEVTMLAKTKRDFKGGIFGDGPICRIDRSAYFKVQLGGKAFFVKKSVATDNLGYEEFRNSRKTAAILSDFDNLRVVEAQLGYDDDHQSWFVSKWEDLERAGFFPIDTWEGNVPNDYGKYPSIDDLQFFDQKLEIVIKGTAIKQEIKKRLADKGLDIHDLTSNLFYNPDTDKFFLLDITVTPRKKGIGQSRY